MVGLVALLMAAGSGIAMAVQGSLNASLSKILGLVEATFVVHFTATVLLALLIFFLPMGHGGWGKIGEVPWYFYLGGALGVVITYGVVASIPRVGVAVATTAIIAGQVTVAMAIDAVGLFGLERITFTWSKGVGLGFLTLGTWLMLLK